MTTDPYKRWIDLIASGTTGLREVDADHGFRRYFGIDVDRRPQFLVLTSALPAVPPVSDFVEQTVGLRADGLWATSFTLREPRMQEIFLRFASDLVRRTQPARDSNEGLRELNRGLDEWRRMLTATPEYRISDEVLRGLVAEAWFALNLIERGRDASTVLGSWLGPFGNPQDFSFPSRAHEVKSIRPMSTEIVISSAAQLTRSAAELWLEVVTLVDADSASQECFTLHSLATGLADAVVGSGASREIAIAPFSHLGVDLADEYYQTRTFAVLDHSTFEVIGSFPRLELEDLEPGITHLTYSIQRSAISPFRIEHSD